MKAVRITKPSSLVMGEPYVLICGGYYYYMVAQYTTTDRLHYTYYSDGDTSNGDLSLNLLFNDPSSTVYKLYGDIPNYSSPCPQGIPPIMNRQSKYLHKISSLLGRSLRPGEFGKFGRAIKTYPDDVLDSSIERCRNATGITDLVSYFLYTCSSFDNKDTNILKGLEDEFSQDI